MTPAKISQIQAEIEASREALEPKLSVGTVVETYFGRLPIAKVHGFPLCQYEFNVELSGEARTFNHDCFAIEQIHELDTMLDKAVAANSGKKQRPDAATVL